MKTLQNIFNCITCFSYAIFIGFLIVILLNIFISTSEIEIEDWKIELFYFILMIVGLRIYEKTYKYLIQ